MKVFPLILAAGASEQIQQRGRFVRCLDGANEFDITPVMESGESLGVFAGFQSGLAITLPSWATQWRITNGATAQTVRLLIADEKIDDNRLVGTVNITGGLSTKLLSPTVVDTAGRIQVASASATQLLAAGTLRGKVIIQNCSAAYIAIGPTSAVTFTTGADAGIILAPSALGTGYPGGSIEVDANTTLYGRADTGATNDVRVLALKYTA